jgi:outer membrane protein TolC
MFSSENMKSWDRTTVTAQPDPMSNLALPMKVRQAGRVALADAQAAGERFRSAKFDLQRQVLTAWTDYAAMAEQVRVARENVALLKLLAETADNRVRAGAPQQDLLKAQIELQMAENELGTMESRLPQMRAMLNAMLGRAADTPLPAPATLPAPRPLFGTDAELIEAAVDQNPELAALSREVQGRRDALELARMRYIPDINPVAGFTGSIEQFVGAMVSIPTAIPMIRAQIQEARADLRRMEAMQRQTKLERGAAFVSALFAMRNSERQITVFRDRIRPAADLALDNSRQSYAAGSVSFVELIDSQRTLLDVRLMIAEAVAARERSLAELEALAGIDIETLEKSRSNTTVPATRGTEVHSHD